MDNASKALIMAGAILIAVAIVGIGIYIFSASNSLTNNAVGQIDTIAVQMFNQTFTQYAKDKQTIHGERALQLANITLATNGVNFQYYTIQYSGFRVFKSLPGNAGAIIPTRSYYIEYGYDDGTGYITDVYMTPVYIKPK